MNKILTTLQELQHSKGVDKRKTLYENLRELLIKKFEHVTWVDFDGETINYKYINFDSNCGMSIIDVYVAAKPIVDFMKKNKVNIELSLVPEIADDWFPERSELWTDIVDENTFELNKNLSPEDIVTELSSLLDDTSEANEEFIKRYA